MVFINRAAELQQLEAWWKPRNAGLAVMWGRRRVGKTALLQHFAADRPTIFHTGGGRPANVELAALARAAEPLVGNGVRDLGARPFVDWDDALETMALVAANRPVLLVFDEWPALVDTSPEL